MTRLRVFVTGQRAFGADAAAVVRRRGHLLVGVASPAYAGRDAPVPWAMGDDATMRHDRLRLYAEQAGVPWVEAGRLTATLIPDVDVILAAHSQAFLGRRTRSRAALAAIGYHPSLLPLHRGRDAVRWTVRDGDRVTGGSVYHLTDAVDAGPLAAQDYCFVPPGITAGGLWRERLHPLGLRLIGKVLDDLAAARVVSVPQEEACATWEPSWERSPLFRAEAPELTAAPTAAPYVVDPDVLRLSRAG